MGITRIDSDIYRGANVGIEQSSYCAMNPGTEPGTFVFGGAVAARETLGGQVACRLALDNFSAAVLDFFHTNTEASNSKATPFNVSVLESAFRSANVSVYQFGHSLAAGGRMAASLIGAVIHHGAIAVGRVGEGSAYLIRDGETFPFFENNLSDPLSGAVNKNAIGSNSLVQVELSSIEILGGDTLAVFSSELESDKITALGDYFRSYDLLEGQPAADLCQLIFPELANTHFALAAKVGADTIYLKDRFS